ncbi:MAG: alpha/beta hydrolase [Bacteroidales bacterium]|nr:alpha/beta hydrolase [Bacteroidales bacterium]
MKNTKTNITYNIDGEGDTTLLFVHGAFIDMSYWSAQVDFFKNKYRVVTLDLPGHALSGKTRDEWSITSLGEDLSEFIRALNLKNVILIGHSMGGDIILEVAIKCPDAVIGFIGIDNFKNAGAAMPEKIQSMMGQMKMMLKMNFSFAAEMFATKALLSPATDAAISSRVVNDYKNMDKKIGYDLICSTFDYYNRERELMNQLKLKMYLINVDNIPTNKELLTKNAASGYEVLPIKGTCHYPMLENPYELNKLILEVVGKM